MLAHNVTDRPWLAADELLAPIPAGADVFTTGAWILEDEAPLSPELSRLLDAGDPPIYFGFGSMPAPPGVARVLMDAARALGRRAVISRGWAELDVESGSDCLAIDDVNQQRLFPRVVAIVHHGGAGTTATAARSGTPQVIAPMFGDQFYFGGRVRELGIGASVTALTAEALTSALQETLVPAVAARARDIAGKLPSERALVAARARDVRREQR